MQPASKSASCDPAAKQSAESVSSARSMLLFMCPRRWTEGLEPGAGRKPTDKDRYLWTCALVPEVTSASQLGSPFLG